MKKNMPIQTKLPLIHESGSIVYNNYSSPLPMQYLGSKSRISPWILNNIRTNFPSCNTFFELFGGSGAVSCAAMKYDYKLITNDIQPYSYNVLRSIFFEKRDGLKELSNEILGLNGKDKLLSNGRNDATKLLERETELFKSSNKELFNWNEYREFCDSTPILNGNEEEIIKLRNDNKWNLFIKYYANTYFGIKQCLALDTLREYADQLEPNLKAHLIASTISVMTFAVSSTTHLAQFLKANSEQRVINLIKKRNIDIIKEVSKRLQSLCHYSLPKWNAEVMNLDYKDAIRNVNLKDDCVIYIDPPYFKEHYSRYYHILDTYYLYDYPMLTNNPRIGKVTIGRYRRDRFVSEFGLKGEVKNAFKKIFTLCHNSGVKIVLSYANTSLLSNETILEIAESVGYESHFEHKNLMHSAQGQSGNRNVIEYLYFFQQNGK